MTAPRKKAPSIGDNGGPELDKEPKSRAEMGIFESARHIQQGMGFDMTGTMTLTEVGFVSKILARMNDKTTGTMHDGRPSIWMNDETLMKLTRLGARQVKRLRKRAEDLGVLIVQRGTYPGQATHYAPGDLVWLPHLDDGRIDWMTAVDVDDDGRTYLSTPMTNMSSTGDISVHTGDKFVLQTGQECHPKENAIQYTSKENIKERKYKEKVESDISDNETSLSSDMDKSSSMSEDVNRSVVNAVNKSTSPYTSEPKDLSEPIDANVGESSLDGMTDPRLEFAKDDSIADGAEDVDGPDEEARWQRELYREEMGSNALTIDNVRRRN